MFAICTALSILDVLIHLTLPQSHEKSSMKFLFSSAIVYEALRNGWNRKSTFYIGRFLIWATPHTTAHVRSKDPWMGSRLTLSMCLPLWVMADLVTHAIYINIRVGFAS